MTEDIALKVRLEAGESATSVKALKESILDLKNGALEAAAAGDEALAAKFTAAAAKAKDKVNDLNKEISILGDTGSKLQAVVKIGGVIAQGFAAAQGAAALFGNSSEEVQNQLLKVQAAMALVQGFQGFAEGVKIMQAFGLQTKIASIGVKLFGTEAAASMALATAGVSVLVAGVIAFVAAVFTSKDAAISLGDVVSGAYKKIKKVVVETKSEEETIYENRKKSIVAAQSQLDLAKAQGKSAWELFNIENKLLDLKLAQAKAELEWVKIDIFASESRKNAAAKAYEELTNQKIALNTNYNKMVNEELQKQTEKKLESDKIIAENEMQMLIDIANQQDIQRQKDLEWEAMLQKQKEDEFNQSMKDITAIVDADAEAKQQQLEADKRFADEQKAIEKAKLEADKRFADEQKAEEKAKWDARLKIAQQGTNALIHLNETVMQIEIKNAHGSEAQIEKIRKQSFNRNKELQIVGAIISGIQAVQSIMATQSLIPEPFNAAFKAAEIGVSIATTIANIAKISATQYTGSGSTSGGAPPSTPSASGVSIRNPNLQSTLLGQQQNQNTPPPQKVYVLEHDITKTQGRVKVYEDKGMIH